MNLLAFDTGTEQLSVALRSGPLPDGRLWQAEEPGGAQASARLIPLIQSLMDQAGLRFSGLQAIVFGRGPGSFTGLRTACSVAQGLAWGADVPVLPVDSLLALAEEARHRHAPAAARWRVLAVLDARMGELYAGRYQWRDGSWSTEVPPGLCTPQQAATLLDGPVRLAGNAFATEEPWWPGAAEPPLAALPTAAALLRLAPALLAEGAAVPPEQAMPLYLRDQVALTTAQREALRPAPVPRAGAAGSP